MWDYNIFLAGTRGSEAIYDIPNVRITNYRKTGRSTRSSFATAPGGLQQHTNTFARKRRLILWLLQPN
jgi:hypothetical protein